MTTPQELNGPLSPEAAIAAERARAAAQAEHTLLAYRAKPSAFPGVSDGELAGAAYASAQAVARVLLPAAPQPAASALPSFHAHNTPPILLGTP